jgi:hypothetical protein
MTRYGGARAEKHRHNSQHTLPEILMLLKNGNGTPLKRLSIPKKV